MYFAVVSSSFADVLEENYFNFNIVFAASEKSEFQRLIKGIYQPVLKLCVLQCGLVVDL